MCRRKFKRTRFGSSHSEKEKLYNTYDTKIGVISYGKETAGGPYLNTLDSCNDYSSSSFTI